MTDGFVLGVDLGTSHTVAMLRRPDGRTRPLLFDGQPLLPSAVYLDTTGRLHVGRDAVRLGQAEPGRLEPNPKRHVDAETVLLGSAEVPTADLLAALLSAVAREAVAATGFLPPAVLTYPAAWGSRRRAVLTTALTRAGWPPATQLLPEPVGAARYFADVLRRPVPVGSALAVFDFGGGTLDVAVVRNEGVTEQGLPRFTVAASGGLDDLGGLDLDAALVEHLGTELKQREPAAWAALGEPVTLAQWRARRQFWDDVRGAKEMLSRTALAPVPVPGVEHAVHLTRDEFEAVAAPLLRRGVAETGAVLSAAGVTPTELAGLFLVGGSSRVPLVARLLHSELGIAPTVLEQPEFPVAEGAIIVVTAASSEHAVTPAEPMRPAAVPPVADTAAHPAPNGTNPAGVTAAGSAAADAAEGDVLPALAAPAAAGGSGPAKSPPLATEAMEPTAGATEAELAAMASAGQAAPAHPAAPPNAAPPASGSPASGSRASGSPASGPAVSVPSSAASAGGAWPGAAPSSAAGTHGGEQHYAEPVDPWATGEAAAFGNATGGPLLHPGSGAPVSAGPTPSGSPSWLASTDPDPARDGRPAAGGRLPAYRRKVLWLVAAVTVVVLGAAATLVAVFWPGYSALEYQPLAGLHRIKPAVPVTSAFGGSALRDGRAYFASVDENGTLGVVAAAADTGKTFWTSVEAGVASRWEFFFTLPGAVVAISDNDSITSARRIVLLDPGSGKKMWDRTVDSNDGLLFAGDKVVLVDSREGRLVGLEVGNQGYGAWQKKNPKSQSGATTTQAVAVTTEKDFAGPATTDGVAFAEPFDDDERIVQIGVDNSARVLDAGSGDIVAGPRQSVAGTNDEIIAHDGRLIVAESADARRLFAYDLEKLEPRVLYTPAANVALNHLTPCGTDRICLVETTGYDAKSAQVVAINAAKGGVVWRRPLANVNGLVPVGEAVLASLNTSPVRVSLLDAAGKVAWTRDGVAGRLDAGNTLQFSKALSASADDPALAGEHLGDAAVPLGSLADVRSATCAWDTSHLACVAGEDFIVQRFAG